ncbi:MAG TPA: FAD-dependent oxidoreductase [Thermomicrobiales bacterium]|nr:FAD-dependent oxidoreductase [Thermomicrobiales bacterium]
MDQQAHGSTHAVRQPGALTRRRFLQMVGATAGSAAVLNVLTAWGQVPIEGQSAPPKMDGNGNGTKVIVIGAGPGGSVAAYELMQLGYDVTVIEARDRVGGHVFTVKNGAKTEEYGKGEQVCDWPEGMWWDAGPSRIPHYHRGFFHYAREFNVPLIDHNNINLNGWVYNQDIEGGLNEKRIRLGTMQADMAGYTSQYLAQAIDQGKLDEELTPEDAEYIKSYLINWGLLSSSDLSYEKSDHRGFTHFPDVFSAGEIADPYAMTDLAPFAAAALRSSGGYIAATSTYDWQQTMVKPKGGIGELYDVGFRNALGDRVKLNCEVTEIRQSEDGVRIVYLNKETGETEEVTGDYAMCNMPLSVLIKIKTDFSKEFTEATRSVPYAMAHRLAGGFKRRFWEEDDWIYGGQSFSNNPQVGVIDYPDDDYNTPDGGAMMMAYNFGNMAGEISRLSFEDRIELALTNASQVHPQIRDDFISGFSVAWHLEPYSLGAWPSYNAQTRATVMPRLQQPDGRVYLVGEHLSNVNAWIEGATQAAWMQVEQLHRRVMQG